MRPPPPTGRLGRSDALLAAAALLAGALFFVSLPRLWPLAAIEVTAGHPEIEARARAALAAAGLDAAGWRGASRLAVDAEALDYLQRAAGDARAQAAIREGLPVFRHEVFFKRRGDPDQMWVRLRPEEGLFGWGRTLQDDAPAAGVGEGEARALAERAVDPWLGPAADWEERGSVEQERPARTDRSYIWERPVPFAPDLRERLMATVAGDRVSAVERSLVVPEAARRATRARQAPVVALQMVGFLLAAGLGIAAFVVFLTRLRAGTVRLGPAARWAGVIAVAYMVTQALRFDRLLLAWDPLWPRWIAGFSSLGTAVAEGAWILLLLFVVIAAGDAVDRETGAGRGASLWAVGRGRIAGPETAVAALRGFWVGLLCGGALAAGILALGALAGGWSPIQPQGFFFYALNSRLPALATLLYFLMVALVEELSYRVFAGAWILSRTGSKALAIGVPALLYGLTHTGLGFLPPAEPFWGRAVVLTLVGLVWGWAFFRYGALTVVLSHFTADLFIFNWPRLASGDPWLVAKAVATVAVPLLPVALWLLMGRRRSSRPE